MDQTQFFINNLYNQINSIQEKNNSKYDYILSKQRELIEKFNVYNFENSNEKELYAKSISYKNYDLKQLTKEYNELYNIYDSINKEIPETDLIRIENNDIHILLLIDDTYVGKIIKILFNKKWYVIKIFKNKKNFFTEYNIHKFLEKNNFNTKCPNILLKYNFCKFSDYNIIDNNNLLNDLYTEYFILMDYYDGDLFSLLENNEHITYYNYIKKFLFDTVKCLYKNNFYYLDIKLENFLYKKDVNNNITIVLCDLGGFFWNYDYDISYTPIYTNINTIMYNILQKKQKNINTNYYSILDLKNMMIHSLCLTVISLYSCNQTILNHINEYNENVEMILNVFIKSIKYNNLLNSNEIYFIYQIYVKHLNEIINVFLENIYYTNNNLGSIISLIKYSYLQDESKLDNFFLNFFY